MTDTNQASEDELREKINSALFADDFPILNDVEKDAVDRILAIIRDEKLKLLDRLEKQATIVTSLSGEKAGTIDLTAIENERNKLKEAEL